MAKTVTSTNIVVTIFAAILVVIGVSTLLKTTGDCEDCLRLSVVFDPPNRKEDVVIWVDLNQVRLNTWKTKHSPWTLHLDVAPGTHVRLVAQQIDITQPGILDCQISDGKSKPIHHYRTGIGEVPCDYL